MTYRTKLAVTAITLALSVSAFAQTAKPARIRGTITSVTADMIVVHRNSGDDAKIAITPKTPVAAFKNIKLADIKKGSFIGTAATTGVDGKMTAREVVVFPEAMRGTGEGHYAWDLGDNSTMTNANVDSVLTATDGRNLKLSYKGGTSDIIVPPNVPVVTFTPATTADLLVGKKVVVTATPASAGAYDGLRVAVEKNGVAPPM